jgi:hypothetical protein
MPNWCGNTLVLRHEDPAMIKRAETAFAEGKFLTEFIPVPEDLMITSGRLSDPKEQELLELAQLKNRTTHGYETWYDFCVGEWGTKWDVGDSQGINDVQENEIVVYFDSAWSPPIAAYERLEALGFEVDAMYYESGMCYAGMYSDGSDDYYDLSNMSSAEISATLPTTLDEAFGISESMAEYEAENEDEVTTWYKDGVEECKLEPHKAKKD